MDGVSARQGAVNVTAIDELSNIIGRLRAFMREVAESREDNRVYWMHSTHDKLETELYERRLKRLTKSDKSFLPWCAYCRLIRASMVKC